MSNNKNLQQAKKNNNDEFYTCYDDIARQIPMFDLKGKTVYCNCDNWERSYFFSYFYYNFEKLGLKKLLCTGYNEGGHGYYAVYDGYQLLTDMLYGDGDYKSDECLVCLKACDVVITNPPFSLFKDYVSLLMEYGKKFIIIGSENGITYKNIFPYIMNNEIWVCNDLIKQFINPDGKLVKFGNICWYTNMVSDEVKKPLPARMSYSNEYKRYDNYDAIDVSSVKDIPNDYYGVIGVPVSYMKYHDPMVYDIVGLSSSSRDNAGKYFLGGTTRPIMGGKKKYTRLFIKRRETIKAVS